VRDVAEQVDCDEDEGTLVDPESIGPGLPSVPNDRKEQMVDQEAVEYEQRLRSALFVIRTIIWQSSKEQSNHGQELNEIQQEATVDDL